jgi:hypothetical protein
VLLLLFLLCVVCVPVVSVVLVYVYSQRTDRWHVIAQEVFMNTCDKISERVGRPVTDFVIVFNLVPLLFPSVCVCVWAAQ